MASKEKGIHGWVPVVCFFSMGGLEERHSKSIPCRLGTISMTRPWVPHQGRFKTMEKQRHKNEKKEGQPQDKTKGYDTVTSSASFRACNQTWTRWEVHIHNQNVQAEKGSIPPTQHSPTVKTPQLRLSFTQIFLHLLAAVKNRTVPTGAQNVLMQTTLATLALRPQSSKLLLQRIDRT